MSVLKSLSWTFGALSLVLVGASAQARDGIPADDSCARQAVEEAMVETVRSLSADDLAKAAVQMVDVKFLHELEMFPPQRVYSVVVETGLPGWVEYQITLRGDGTCKPIRVRVTGEE